MGQFKPMVKMTTSEPSVELKLKKGGAVEKKMQSGGSSRPPVYNQGPGSGKAPGKPGANSAPAPGEPPKKPSMMERLKAMRGKLMAGKPAGPVGKSMGMKEGGESKAEHFAEMKKMAKTAKALKEHADKPASKAHKGLKKGGACYATGGVVNGQGGYKTGGVIKGQGGYKTGGVAKGQGGYKSGGKAKKYAEGGAPVYNHGPGSGGAPGTPGPNSAPNLGGESPRGKVVQPGPSVTSEPLSRRGRYQKVTTVEDRAPFTRDTKAFGAKFMNKLADNKFGATRTVTKMVKVPEVKRDSAEVSGGKGKKAYKTGGVVNGQGGYKKGGAAKKFADGGVSGGASVVAPQRQVGPAAGSMDEYMMRTYGHTDRSKLSPIMQQMLAARAAQSGAGSMPMPSGRGDPAQASPSRRGDPEAAGYFQALQNESALNRVSEQAVPLSYNPRYSTPQTEELINNRRNELVEEYGPEKGAEMLDLNMNSPVHYFNRQLVGSMDADRYRQDQMNRMRGVGRNPGMTPQQMLEQQNRERLRNSYMKKRALGQIGRLGMAEGGDVDDDQCYAKGGSVNDSGRAEKMPRKQPSKPVSINQLSGTFKKGGVVMTPAQKRLSKTFKMENEPSMKAAKKMTNLKYGKR